MFGTICIYLMIFCSGMLTMLAFISSVLSTRVVGKFIVHETDSSGNRKVDCRMNLEEVNPRKRSFVVLDVIEDRSQN